MKCSKSISLRQAHISNSVYYRKKNHEKPTEEPTLKMKPVQLQKKSNVVQSVFSGRRNFEVLFTGFENRSCSYHCRSHSMSVFFAGSILNDYERKRNKIVIIKGKECVCCHGILCRAIFFFQVPGNIFFSSIKFFHFLKWIFLKNQFKKSGISLFTAILQYQMEIFQEYHG